MMPLHANSMYWKSWRMEVMNFPWLIWVWALLLHSWGSVRASTKYSRETALEQTWFLVLCILYDIHLKLDSFSVKYQAKPGTIYTSTKSEESFLSALQRSGTCSDYHWLVDLSTCGSIIFSLMWHRWYKWCSFC